MRLLNTRTHKLREFIGDIPNYAILSHTWASDAAEEISYLSMRDDYSNVVNRKGFSKIFRAASQAYEDGYDWIWIDTCCIDRASTAEVSEAVNSMYRWFQDAAVCYVHLSDVPGVRFADSCWFEQGWTLQELIAPRYIEFYTNDWMELGTKTSLEMTISRVTGICSDVLRGTRSPYECNAAERMSWASSRHTARPEDMAYCLLGLFNVNIPVMYGEGASRAFQRLQHEVLKWSEDLTLLAWTGSGSVSPKKQATPEMPGSPVLTPDPKCFRRPDFTTYIPSTAFGFDDVDFLLFPDLGHLRWRDLHKHQWNASLESLSQHPLAIDPPVVTPRGIALTLLVDLGASESRVSSSHSNDPAASRDVLAWLYMDVAPRSSSRPASRVGLSPDSPGRSMMVCIWLRLSTTTINISHTPVIATRLPDKGLVCVPMMFLSRFRPLRLYLQHEEPQKAPRQPTWEIAQPTNDNPQAAQEPPSRCLQLRCEHSMSNAQVLIASFYPHAANLQLKPNSWGMECLLSHIPLDTFDVILKDGRVVEVFGALHFVLRQRPIADSSGSTPPPPIDDIPFVVLFGQSHTTEQYYCHVETVRSTSSQSQGDPKRFWSEYFSTGGKHLGPGTGGPGHDADAAPTDRSAASLSDGSIVVATIKKRVLRGGESFTPTLVISHHTDGGKFARTMKKALVDYTKDDEGAAL